MRRIRIFNFKTNHKEYVGSVAEAMRVTSVPRKQILEQLNNPDARQHELVRMIEDNTISLITLSIVKKTQTYEFSYCSDYLIKLIPVSININGSCSVCGEPKCFGTAVEVAEFLGCSTQTIYNRKYMNNAFKLKPIQSSDGMSYLISFGELSFIADTPKVTVKIFLARLSDASDTSGVPKTNEYKMFTNINEMYIWCMANSPVPLVVNQEEFTLTCSSLETISDKQKALLDDEKYYWMDYITNCPQDCLYGFVPAFDFVGTGANMFSKGIVIARIA